MRPVRRGNQPNDYQPNGDLGTDQDSMIYKQLGTSITLSEAMDSVWGVKLADAKITVPPAYYAQYKPLVDNIYKNLRSRYIEAGPALVRNLGPYCAYCEITASGYDVEHEVAKSPYIDTIVSWTNLLPACRTCNTLKGNKPPLKTTRWWVQDQTDQEEYRDAIRSEYFWPDRYVDTYPEIYPALQLKIGNTWLINHTRTFDYHVTIAGDSTKRRVVATYTDPTTNVQRTYPARVKMFARKNRPDAEATIKFLRLNDVQDEEGISDYRLYFRTLAWYAALRKVEAMLAARSQDDFDRVWRDTLHTAGITGFFIVWVKVLSNWKYQGVNLARQFINDTTALFPGTNPGLLNAVP
jgi:hypothetical protein